MIDMLVKLYDAPDCGELKAALEKQGIFIKRAMACDITPIRTFIQEEFGIGWADEATKGILNQPSSCYIATREGEVIGFAAYDATAKGFFGPTGVKKDCRGLGLGKALYLTCLHAMYEAGYPYGIIGDAGPTAFYEKTSGAIPIPGSRPGEYRNMVKWAPPKDGE